MATCCRAAGINPATIAQLGADVVLSNGQFHADPTPQECPVSVKKPPFAEA
ncbi:hypothetical protein [Sphingobium sp. YR768]|jgi:hypothetical protein|uniref:hypothetical protein n=1 Tax=Sphingobium sp. YR768 TaxID=1884365 RepID=UPI0008D66748|nr:hypothetical protein [Sphingobium sp. YR768]SER56260.1 hypothetical protein SAMN05518866_11392 [Sphingobium sp. YR768]